MTAGWISIAFFLNTLYFCILQHIGHAIWKIEFLLSNGSELSECCILSLANNRRSTAIIGATFATTRHLAIQQQTQFSSRTAANWLDPELIVSFSQFPSSLSGFSSGFNRACIAGLESTSVTLSIHCLFTFSFLGAPAQESRFVVSLCFQGSGHSRAIV